MKHEEPLSPESERVIRKYADLLLRKASAYDRFPTPVDDLLDAAKLEVARESVLAKIGLDGIYRRLPNFVKLAPDAVKSARDKLLGLLDRRDRSIHLDPDMHPKRRIHVTIHEVGHELLPHQRKMFQVLEESDAEMDPDTKDLFEREASCFASEVLFQRDAFAKEAADSAIGIKVPIALSRKYGPSVYSAARRYVETHRLPCALVVFEMPVCMDGEPPFMDLRRVVTSSEFKKRFGMVTWPRRCNESHFFFRNCPSRWCSRPSPLRIKDCNGEPQACLAEAFNTKHNVLFLVYPAILGSAFDSI
jgi:hypothetical protein